MAAATTATTPTIASTPLRDDFDVAAYAGADGMPGVGAGLIIVGAEWSTAVASPPPAAGRAADAMGIAPAPAAEAAATRASENSRADWKRSSARLASARRTTVSSAAGTCPLQRDGGR